MSKYNILRIKVDNIRFFNNNTFDLDFTNKLQVTNHDLDHAYYNLISSIYLPKTIAIKGVNASGKTTILELINLVVSLFINSKPLNDPYIESLLNKFYMGSEITFTFFYEFDNVVYKLVSNIDLEVSKFRLDRFFIFTNEYIYKKALTNKTAKLSLFNEGYSLEFDRNNLKKDNFVFLMKEHSANFIYTAKVKPLILSSTLSFNSFYNKNESILSDINYLDNTIIRFLDPSIKRIKRNLILEESSLSSFIQKDRGTYKVHLTNGGVIEATSLQLHEMLSAGTIRGLNILNDIKRVLKTGGYYIIDELELHLNKSIIIHIIRLFKSNETNPLNASLIFTTHYTEMIDIFDRNDQIYIAHRSNDYSILLTNYSDYTKQNQLKKSDSYFADTFNLGTAISYDLYNELRKSFKEQHQE